MVVDHVSHSFPPGYDSVRLVSASLRSHHFRPHAHAEYAIAVVERGVEAVRYRGSTEYAPTGSLLLLDAEVLHAGRPGAEEGWDYRVFYVAPSLLREITSKRAETPGPAPSFAEPVRNDPRLAQRLSRVHRLMQTPLADRLEVQEQFYDALAELLARHTASSPPPTDKPDEQLAMVRQVREFLAADLHHTPSLDDLATEVSLSRFGLLRAFQRATGLTPHGFLIQLRLRKAQDLLSAGHTVADAAAASGFSDQSHLHRHFRATFGAPPGRFARRRQICNDVQATPPPRS
ncbi:AraC family transcriptional regulator [Saccharopolyspora sp. K220]|uniref:AraC family transcriptional regulator n=1 Tax=Saccharopolyspora soli TaxID=2926618 RepID=UPI001F56B08F|nr:AraC family transcriptional regulator [Saccharopolyspora soli]MCI2420604.1 AraC family transcriptional regulator [Saccharopolyspora soli]